MTSMTLSDEMNNLNEIGFSTPIMPKNDTYDPIFTELLIFRYVGHDLHDSIADKINTLISKSDSAHLKGLKMTPSFNPISRSSYSAKSTKSLATVHTNEVIEEVKNNEKIELEIKKINEKNKVEEQPAMHVRISFWHIKV